MDVLAGSYAILNNDWISIFKVTVTQFLKKKNYSHKVPNFEFINNTEYDITDIIPLGNLFWFKDTNESQTPMLEIVNPLVPAIY